MNIKPSIQWLRHTVQLLTLIFVLVMPFWAQYGHYVYRHKIDHVIEQWPSSFQKSSMAMIESIFHATEPTANKDEILKHIQNVRGNTWSAQFFGVSVSDPLGGLESMLASRKFVYIIAVGITIPILFTLLFGRVFCSWMCPIGFVLELAAKVREPLKRILTHFKIAPKNVLFWRGNKYVLLTIGLLLSFMFGASLLSEFYPPALIVREIQSEVNFLFTQADNNIFKFTLGGLTGITLFLVILAFIEIFVSDRLWCRYLCPGGALYALIGSKRIVRVRRDAVKCTACAECTKVCGMGLNPMLDSTGIECDNCLACTSVCEENAICTHLSLTDAPLED